MKALATDPPICPHPRQDYFARRWSRTWVRPGEPSPGELLTASAATGGGELTFSDDESDDPGSGGGGGPGGWGTGPRAARRRWGLWRNIIIGQGEDSLGATVTLGQLLKSSEAIAKKLVINDLIDRFKGLIAKCGPELRLINIFGALCFVEGRPSKANQEMCVRKLWMNPADRYAFGATFHEVGRTADADSLAYRLGSPPTIFSSSLFSPILTCRIFKTATL